MFLLLFAICAVDAPTLISAEHDAWVDEAGRSMEADNPDAALPLLTRYLSDVQKHPETANTSLLGRAWLLASAAHFRRGQEDDGQRALVELVRLRPDLVPDASYPPLFLRLHQKARQRIEAKANAELVIAAPDDAVLLLNGRGLRPGRITQVPPGIHFVVMMLGTKQIVRKVAIRPGETRRVPFGGAKDSGGRQSYFALEADPRVAPSASGGETSGGEATASPRMLTLTPEAESQRTLVVAPAEVEQQKAVAAESAASIPLYRRWWLWAIVGGVVAGATVTTVLLTTARVGDVAVNAEWR